MVPWNGPMMGMGQKATPALAAGNTVVAKPPELAPFGAYLFAELALEAGVPPGVLNVVAGGAEAGEALVRHPGVDKVSFTGGGVVAKRVMTLAAETLNPVALELGGQSANLIFDDANLDVAVPMAAALGVQLLSGQGCALPTRLYVRDGVYDEVVSRLVPMAQHFRVGDPLDPKTQMGPVITEHAVDRILSMVGRATSDGATLLTGGARLGGVMAPGYFVAPTVLADVAHDSEIAREEVLGRCFRCCDSATRTRWSRRPTTAATGWLPTLTPAIWPALTASPMPSRPARSRSTACQGCRPRRRSAATNKAVSGARAVAPGSRSGCAKNVFIAL
jgi:aldehyde dehydrogenase (NAD+)